MCIFFWATTEPTVCPQTDFVRDNEATDNNKKNSVGQKER